jgi:hypothetical protein
MNYPVWDVRFGAGLLIALVAILHVFVSHFAVGGGLFLVLTEKKARPATTSHYLLGWSLTPSSLSWSPLFSGPSAG